MFERQRIVRGWRGGGICFWAWAVSVGLHLILLGGFWIVRFSRSELPVERRRAPRAKVSKPEKLHTEPVVPKPKVKRPLRESPGRRRKILQANQIFNIPKQRVGDNLEDRRKSVASPGEWTLKNGISLPYGVEFFDSRSEERKICYVVDSSGSMKGMFGEVRTRLGESIRALQADQYFYIIFFGGGRLLESGDGLLVRATQQAKSSAREFIDSVEPAGRTNAMAALERAVRIGDSRGNSASVIYFLTDGFELASEDVQGFTRKTAALLERFAPATKINTIGFWPSDKDSKILEAIATESDGEFVLVVGDGGSAVDF